MSSVLDPEVASVLGALDSDAFGSGYSPNAHLTRVLAMGANHELTKRRQIFNLWQDGSEDGNAADTGLIIGSASLGWGELTYGPHPVPKMPGHDYADFHVWYSAPQDAIWFQIETLRTPLSALGEDGDTNVEALPMTAAGTAVPGDTDYLKDVVLSLATIENVPINPGPFERFRFFQSAGPLGTLGDTGVFGSPNNGTIEQLHENFLVYAGTSWHETDTGVRDSWDFGGHAVVLHESGGTVLVEARKIVSVFPFIYDNGGSPALAQGLAFDPPLDRDQIRLAEGHEFSIYKLPDFRIASITAVSRWSGV